MWINLTEDEWQIVRTALKAKMRRMEKTRKEYAKDGVEPVAEQIQLRIDKHNNILSTMNVLEKHGENDQAFRDAHRERYSFHPWTDGDIDIDEDAMVSSSEEGAYVMMWGWVSNEQAGIQDVCRTCGEEYAPAGDGYDGECPDCADKTDLKERLEKAGWTNLGPTVDGESKDFWAHDDHPDGPFTLDEIQERGFDEEADDAA